MRLALGTWEALIKGISFLGDRQDLVEEGQAVTGDRENASVSSSRFLQATENWGSLGYDA